jgi:hypothetical protein
MGAVDEHVLNSIQKVRQPWQCRQLAGGPQHQGQGWGNLKQQWATPELLDSMQSLRQAAAQAGGQVADGPGVGVIAELLGHARS